MAPTPERPFTRFDGVVLLAALILGLAWAASAWPSLLHIHRMDAIYLRSPFASARARNFGPEAIRAIRPGLRLLSAVLGPLTLALMVLRWHDPGPRLRRGFLRPGVAACLAASVVLIAEMAYYPFSRWTFWPGGEYDRIARDMGSNFVQLPRLRPSEGANLAGSIACGIGEHPGLAVLGVFFACWAAGLRSPGPSWIDRLGIGLGVLWSLAAIGFLLVPIV